MDKKLNIKFFLWFFLAFGCTAGLLRLIRGLGATTALTDFDPWGFWIGFDVMAGVALAAGGFTLAAIVYIFHLERLRCAVRPAIITAFLGYIIVALGLILDLGIPWNIWHPMIFWQHHSVLFEVGMCVILYLNVLAIETAPIVLEHPLFSHPAFHKIYRFLKFFTIPLVILGIMLSTLHQSSLGSLFLIIPFRVYPLWYSPILYLLYFISAVGLGCAMVILESTITGYVYDHKPNVDAFRILGRICSVVLGLYLLIRLADLATRGILPLAFNGSWKSNLFIIEILVSSVIPIFLFNLPQIRKSATRLFYPALLVVLGFIMNRQDILVTMARKGRSLYLPSIGELGVSIALVSGAAIVFFFFVEHFDLFGHGNKPQDPEQQGVKPGHFLFWEVRALEKAFMVFSAAVVLGAGAAFVLMPASARGGYTYPDTPVKGAVGWDTLKIDGNRAREAVLFPHKKHAEMLGGGRDSACVVCHHLSLPHDGPSSCYECHRDMYLEKSIFNHGYHQNILGGNSSCDTCHSHSKAREEVASCNTAACHDNLLESDTSSYHAKSYLDAMHHKCRKCHEKQAAHRVDSLLEMGEPAQADSAKNLGYCGACHPGLPPDQEVVVELR